MNSMIYLLKEFNFTESEAKVYIALLENGACTGYEVSKLSGVARSKIYNILETLLQRGAISNSCDDKTTLYRAESVRYLTASIRSRFNASLNALENEAEMLSQPKKDERIWHLYDWEAAKARCRQMIASAKQRVTVQLWVNELEPSLEELIIAKQEHLDKVLVILYDEKEQYHTKIERFYKHGFEQDKMEEMGGRWMSITMDDQEMIYITFNENGMTEAIYTQNHSMALFAREYAYHDAYCLRIIEHLPESVASEFGENLEGIRNI